MAGDIMSKFISDEEMKALESSQSTQKAFISDEEMQKMSDAGDSYDWSNAPRDLGKAAVDSLPLIGAAAGGVIGTATGGALSIPLGGAGAVPGAVTGAGIGAGLGQSAKDILNHYLFDERKNTKDTLLDPLMAIPSGMAAELGGQAATKGIEKGLSAIPKVGKSFYDSAESLAARALGTERGSVNKMGIDKVKSAGRYALDEKILSPLASTEDMLERAVARKAVGGQKMGQVYDQIDNAGLSSFNPLDEAVKVEDNIGDFWRSPINKGETAQLENTLEAITMRGDKNIPIKEAQLLKEELGKVAKWNVPKDKITDKEQMARDAYAAISKRIDEVVDEGATAIGKDDLLSLLKEGKRDYSNATTAESLLNVKQAREQGNKMLGLTDTIFGSGALAVGGPQAVAAVGAKKVIEGYGSQNAALLSDKIGKFLMKSPQMVELSKSSPQVFQTIIKRLEQSASQQLLPEIPRAAENQKQPPSSQYKAPDKKELIQKTQNSKYGQVLQNAASRGDEAFNAAHFVLSQRDPEYRKQLEDFG